MADQLGGASGNATATDLLTGYTASVASGPISGTMANRAGVTITGILASSAPGNIHVEPSVTGYFDTTTQLSISDANLVASNIKKGVSIFGVSGSAPPVAFGSATVGTGGQYGYSTFSASGLSFTPSTVMLGGINSTSSGVSYGFWYYTGWDSGHAYWDSGYPQPCTLTTTSGGFTLQANSSSFPGTGGDYFYACSG